MPDETNAAEDYVIYIDFDFLGKVTQATLAMICIKAGPVL